VDLESHQNGKRDPVQGEKSYRIRIHITVKRQNLIRIKLTIQKLLRAEDTHNGGVEAENGAVEAKSGAIEAENRAMAAENGDLEGLYLRVMN
jgi:hypothetical protein